MADFDMEMVGDSALIARFGRCPEDVMNRLERAVTMAAYMVEGDIKSKKLSGQVLNRVTGALRASIHTAPIERTEDEVTAKVASDSSVKYAAIHEFGGVTAPHEIRPKNASVLAWPAGAGSAMAQSGNGQVRDMVFAKVVHHPGSRIPERSFMRSTLADDREKIIDMVKRAYVDGMETAAHG